jgi:hypothetical protein
MLCLITDIAAQAECGTSEALDLWLHQSAHAGLAPYLHCRLKMFRGLISVESRLGRMVVVGARQGCSAASCPGLPCFISSRGG